MCLPVALILIGTLLLTGSASFAAAGDIDFVHDVRPILQRHCYSCHGPEKQKSGLRLDIRSEAFRGGELYGASLVAGQAKQSPLIQFVADPDADLKMPPEGGLTAEEIATLTAWVDSGAIWPDGVDLAKLTDPRAHWAFQPLPQEVPVPAADPLSPHVLDQFIRDKLLAEQLQPNAPADPVHWLRRVTFDLTGLPPTPEEVDEYLAACHSNPGTGIAEAHIVARLLGSSRYGERWAQHWLDVVRYADTHGFEVNTERPNAWPYRDYVIEALNRDVPYDQFIREQIAGDACGQDAATGFLVTASVLLPGQIGKDPISIRQARQDAVDEIVNNIGLTFVGLSIGCARCHDHKFDPIKHRDYYAMQAFVAGVEYGDRRWRKTERDASLPAAGELQKQLREAERQWAQAVPPASSGALRPAVHARLNSDRFPPVTTRRLRFTILSTNELEPCLDEVEIYNSTGQNVALAAGGTRVSSSGDQVSAGRHELPFVHDGRYGNSRSWMSNQTGQGWVEFEFTEAQPVERVVWGRDREGIFADRLPLTYRIEVIDEQGQWHSVADASDRAGTDPAAASTLSTSPGNEADSQWERVEELQRLLVQVNAVPLAFAGVFRQPDEIHLLKRGDPEQPQDQVSPATPEFFGPHQPPAGCSEQERRIALAAWLTDPENPLTARVMVNRIWQGHFGVGLVETTSDFGLAGASPSHPQLLDWLAREFIRSGWSIKHMHRLIVLSQTYGQSTAGNATALSKDADNRWLWRYPLRRMDAEQIRDGMLACSGELNLEMGGPGYNLFDQRGGLSGFKPIEAFTGAGLRRLIYAHKVRREPDSIFGVFDRPDAGQSTSRRRTSTTPTQALNLFNSQFTCDRAQALAQRIEHESEADRDQQIADAYLRVLNRRPTAAELSDAQALAQSHGLGMVCLVLFNTNEFLFLP